jgi:hypothetical protein
LVPFRIEKITRQQLGWQPSLFPAQSEETADRHSRRRFFSSIRGEAINASNDLGRSHLP